MAKIGIKQINNTPATEGGVVVYNGSTNEWSNNDSNSILLPSGTTAERPSLALDGHQRYNTDINEFEFFENGAWRGFSDNTALSAIGLTTGLAIGGALTINGGDNTKFDISDGNGWVVNSYTDPNNPTLATVDWTGLTAITPLGLLTDIVTYIFIDNAGAVYQQLTYPNPQDSRDYIFLGVIVHADNTFIHVTNNLPRVAVDTGAQLYDLTNALGFFNINGNIITENGANLNINKSEGVAFKSGANYQIDRANPHELFLPSQTAATVRYRLQNGTEFPNTTDIDPNNYDLGGVLTAITPNNATVQHVYIFPSGQIRIQYGQTVYQNIAAAIEGAPNEVFNIEQNLADNGLLIGLIVLLSSAINLSDPKDATFLRVGRFGDTSSAGSQAVGTLQQAYDNSATPEIVIDTTRGALTLLDNPTPIGAPLFEVQSNDTLTTYFDVSATGTTISGLLYPTIDGNNNDVMTTDGAGNLFFAPAVGGSGETNLAANVGTGSNVFRDKTGVTLNFRSLIGGTNVTLTENADDITIDVASGSPQNLIETFTGDAGSYTALSATDTLNILGGTSVSTSVTGNTLTITNAAPNVDQNLWETMISDVGSIAADTTTDSFSILGGTGISTAIAGDILTITNDSPNIVQSLWETITSDAGSAVANIATDSLGILGGSGISTSITGDNLTIVNDSPNVDQNLWSTLNSDSGSTTADNTADTLIISGGTGISTAIVGDTLTITNTIAHLQNKLDGIVAPAVTDDINAGYEEGSFWIDTVADKAYRCVDSAAGAAIWIETTLQTTDLATVAVTGDHTDLLNIGTNTHTDIDNHISATNNPHSTLLWLTVASDSGSTAADIATDTLTVAGGVGISTSVTGDTLTITNDAPHEDQNLWETIVSDSGSAIANITTDTFTISGGTGISTSIAGDTLTIVNDNPNVDQNLWETIISDSGSVAANTTIDSLTVTGGVGISTSITGDTLTLTNDDPNIDQNIWETFNADSGTATANTLTDIFTFTGGTGITTAIVGDAVTFTNDAPNVDQNIYETVTGDAGTTTAATTTDTLAIVGGTGISTVVTADTVTITNDTPNVDQNLWETMVSDAGSIAADTTTDSFSILGGTGISTSIAGDILTIVNDDPNIVQNLWETVVADAGSASADTATDSLTISGGTGIDTAIVGDVLTITNASPNVDQNLWETITGDSGTSSADTTTDTFNILGGSGITTSVAGDTLTIDSAGGGLSIVTSFAGLPAGPSTDDLVFYTPWNATARYDGTHWVSPMFDVNLFGRDKNSAASTFLKSSGNTSGLSTSGIPIPTYTNTAGYKIYGISATNEETFTCDIELHVDNALADPVVGTQVGTSLSIVADIEGSSSFTGDIATAGGRLACFIRMTTGKWNSPSVSILYSLVAG